MNQRVVPAVLLVLLVVLHVQLWWGRGSVPHVTELQQKIDAQKAKMPKPGWPTTGWLRRYAT